MTERFTDRAREAIEKAREAAGLLGHSYVGSEHLLLGIAREEEGTAARVLRENGFPPERIERLAVKLSGRGVPGIPVQGLTPGAARIGSPSQVRTIPAVSSTALRIFSAYSALPSPHRRASSSWGSHAWQHPGSAQTSAWGWAPVPEAIRYRV